MFDFLFEVTLNFSEYPHLNYFIFVVIENKIRIAVLNLYIDDR